MQRGSASRFALRSLFASCGMFWGETPSRPADSLRLRPWGRRGRRTWLMGIRVPVAVSRLCRERRAALASMLWLRGYGCLDGRRSRQLAQPRRVHRCVPVARSQPARLEEASVPQRVEGSPAACGVDGACGCHVSTAPRIRPRRPAHTIRWSSRCRRRRRPGARTTSRPQHRASA